MKYLSQPFETKAGKCWKVSKYPLFKMIFDFLHKHTHQAEEGFQSVVSKCTGLPFLHHINFHITFLLSWKMIGSYPFCLDAYATAATPDWMAEQSSAWARCKAPMALWLVFRGSKGAEGAPLGGWMGVGTRTGWSKTQLGSKWSAVKCKTH